MGGSGRQSEPEKEREGPFPQVIANAHGGEFVGRDLLAQRAEGLDDLSGGEGAPHDWSGKASEMGNLHGEDPRGSFTEARADGMNRTEALEDARSGALGHRVPGVLDPLSVLVSAGGNDAQRPDGHTLTDIRKCLSVLR